VKSSKPAIAVALSALALALAAPFALAAAARHKPPSPAQIRAAVARATSSRSLWATVNICNTRQHPGVIGIRGQMPALGFPAQLKMTVRLYYWSFAASRFVSLPKVAEPIPLGTVSNGTVQEGAEFTFKPPVILSGAITFQWSTGGRVLATVTKLTSHGDRGVDGADPPGYSTATCRIGA
jgi:hypothetical protein